ncbi:patatin-like phospholipase family protein [Chromobacterium sp. IIBBL 290-4]|uniref:patatin-like phospholipase family protein n=1 Tax=Chromobacterium sp. IIBBL 290-4 TaxID=2953890 RepID=UPI0020B88EC1|nr:patatin-like phospholipase family protein [Chromobacterium sp. IIBBL 290-4]UTH74024.1 patatin-like phospholipase family protein [Chromobacterium sp. IIBBL 290-4]
MFASLLASQEAAASDTPEGVGVVLGGGGARGFAHLGVLKELERLRIPVSCIAGTSAGALIGGIYANGLPLDEIEREFDAADWDQMLAGRPARSEIPYDRKRNDYENYLDVRFGLKDGSLRVPRSAINSQGIELYIHKLTRDRNVDDFDTLPIPFRAVAADLTTGDAVVFGKGSLARALRASMAVPGVFDLVEDDGHLLVDGAIARNVPVQDVKGRCAKHVIVVDVGTPLLKTDEIQTLFDVVSQSTNLAVMRNVQQQMKLLDAQDILIKPDLTGFTAASFSDHKDIMKRGEEAAVKLADQLSRYSVSPAQYEAWKQSLQHPRYPVLDEVKVAGKDGVYTKLSSLKESLNFPGATVPVGTARERLAEIFANGEYDKLSYQVDNIEGRNVMTVTPMERAIGQNYLHFGLNLNSDTPGDSNFTLRASHEWTSLNDAGASWRNDMAVGFEKELRSELYQPLWRDSPVFVAASVGFAQTPFRFYNDDHTVMDTFKNNVENYQLNTGLALGKYGEWRLGLYRQDNRFTLAQGQQGDALDISRFRDVGVQSSLVVDQFDNPRWPRSGYYFNGKIGAGLPSLGSEVNQKFYDLTGELAHTYGDFTARFTAKTRGSVDIRSEAFVPQSLGGFLNLTGYQNGELLASQVALARLMVYWRASSLPPILGSGIYAGVSMEAGRIWGETFTGQQARKWIPAGSVFLGADTILGPLFVGVGNAKGGQLTGYIYLGVNY